MTVLASCGGKGRRPSVPPAPPPAQVEAPSRSDGGTAPAAKAAPVESEPEPKQVKAVAKPEPREPNPYVAPLVRQAGDLTVEAPPRVLEDDFIGRLRTHVDGGLSKGTARVWVGPQVPGFVPLMEGTMELFLLDRVDDEFMAFYRDPYGASSCGLGDGGNCDYFVRIFDLEGEARWSISLPELMSRPTQLEVQDARWADGTLYFNEACQSYSSGAGGKCSALVAYDPEAKEVRWRTRNLVSNGEFLVHGDYIVSSYGFTDERDFLFVVRRSDGKIIQKVPLRKAAMRLTVASDGLLDVIVYPHRTLTYEMQRWDSAKPKLVKTTRSFTEKITGRR